MTKAEAKLRVVPVKVGDLVDDDENARQHDPKNLAAIRDSLVQFGQVEPLVVQKGTRRVIGGNGRLTVMRDLGWTHADVVLVDLTDIEAKALALALNRTGELGRWDREKLNATLKTILSDRPSLAIPGFSADDLKAHMGDQTAFLSQFTATPAGGGGDAGGPTVDPGNRATFVDLVLSLTPENRSQVYALLAKVKEKHKLATSSDALMEVVRHYERTAL